VGRAGAGHLRSAVPLAALQRAFAGARIGDARIFPP